MYKKLDTNFNGTISKQEVRDGFALMGKVLTEAEVDKMFATMDLDKNGKIEYTEFMLAVANEQLVRNDSLKTEESDEEEE